MGPFKWVMFKWVFKRGQLKGDYKNGHLNGGHLRGVLLKRGTKKLVGTHNFSTFRASNCNSKSAKKTIYKIQVIKKKNIIKIRFISRSFLKSQVRSMVGCLKYLSEKKWSSQKFEKIFKSCNRESCAPLAPPHGLYLEKITY